MRENIRHSATGDWIVANHRLHNPYILNCGICVGMQVNTSPTYPSEKCKSAYGHAVFRCPLQTLRLLHKTCYLFLLQPL